MLPLPTITDPRYLCPGESHSISRSVHLARLAAFYPKCRDCSHRGEMGQLPQSDFPVAEANDNRSNRRSLLTLEGVRGVYLNELTRKLAGEYAAAFARLLWEAVPLAGRTDLRDLSSKRPIRRAGPVVVVGFDERPSSPDLVTGVAAALRRMSCQVVDVGQTSMPCFRFAVAHLQAAGGIMITGHGCEPSWTGLDFVSKHGWPISLGHAAPERNDNADPTSRLIRLNDIQERFDSGAVRPVRHGGTDRVFQASVPYLAGLLKEFHALRPLRVAIGCPVRFVRQTLEQLFQPLPVMLRWIEIPQRRRDLLDDDDADVARMRRAVRAEPCDFGLLIDDDGANVALFDEGGERLSPDDLLCLIAAPLLAEHPQGAVVVENSARDGVHSRLIEMNARCWLGGWTQSDIWPTLRHDQAVLGGGATGRVWFADVVPATDAILTLAHVLQTLSLDDIPLSELISRRSRLIEDESEAYISSRNMMATPSTGRFR